MNDFLSIQREIEDVNELLLNKYSDLFKMDNETFKKEILTKVGKINKLKKLSKEELNNIGIVVGVDGSTNRVGGAYPHYIELFQALAKPTVGKDLFLNECYTPMLSSNEEDSEEKERKTKDIMLAQIELDVAIEFVKNNKVNMLMMDGGLIRYKINDNDRYNELRELCEEKDIIFFGVIKDIKTNIIARAFQKDLSIYDRELLFGRLNKGEILEIFDSYNKKYEEEDGLVSAFLRTSKSANAIGLDIIESQREYIEDVSNLVYSLTPDSSRGVPLWLDIVDKEVKITDALIKTMLEEYLDRDIYERFFVSERDRRSL
ncbi:DNA double-strand break repair nuclease NurA [Peptoniphilus stercorisuis]|uniref:NurA domain-containing protein n=1 Tax=Peptoniphilus stercorisuis TaxID=1436965 RepID=A0ABS4KBZ9_9FIRM|nr:DNA double-strand break repair nuclease NurA [Peptoniphilus stercorisuis]MBP2024691.1 hypothetical protein [Peptoniphilus stercorisuis]